MEKGKKKIRDHRPLIRYLYWRCYGKCEQFFLSEKIPRECPLCSSRFIRGATKEMFDLCTDLSIPFEYYQIKTGDNLPGAYGRFVARRFGLP